MNTTRIIDQTRSKSVSVYGPDGKCLSWGMAAFKSYDSATGRQCIVDEWPDCVVITMDGYLGHPDEIPMAEVSLLLYFRTNRAVTADPSRLTCATALVPGVMANVPLARKRSPSGSKLISCFWLPDNTVSFADPFEMLTGLPWSRTNNWICSGLATSS